MSLAFPISVEAKRLDGRIDHIDFPLTHTKMKQTVCDFGENPEIVHYDPIPFDLEGKFGFDTTTPIRQIDLVAHALEQTTGAEEIVDSLVRCKAPAMPTTPLGLANLFLQSAKVPWVNYDVPLHTVARSDEESFGYHLAKQMGVYDELENDNISSYFDFAQFGSDNAGSNILGTDGYLDTSKPMPSFNRYGWNEVATLCSEDEQIPEVAEPNSHTTWLIDTENETSSHACAYPDIQAGDDVWWLNHTCKGQNALDSQIVTLLGNLVEKGTKSHRYVVVTNGESLDTAVAFWQARGYDISKAPLTCSGQAR